MNNVIIAFKYTYSMDIVYENIKIWQLEHFEFENSQEEVLEDENKFYFVVWKKMIKIVNRINFDIFNLLTFPYSIQVLFFFIITNLNSIKS